MTQQASESGSAYPAEFLDLVDQFVNFANTLADQRATGEVSAAILFAAGRYNAFNFLAGGGSQAERPAAVEYFVNEYRKAFESNLDGAVGPLLRADA